MDFTGLIKNLKTHEMEYKDIEKQDTKKKKNIAFRCFSSDNEDLDHEDDDNEELSLLIKNVRRMRGKFNSY